MRTTITCEEVLNFLECNPNLLLYRIGDGDINRPCNCPVNSYLAHKYGPSCTAWGAGFGSSWIDYEGIYSEFRHDFPLSILVSLFDRLPIKPITAREFLERYREGVKGQQRPVASSGEVSSHV